METAGDNAATCTNLLPSSKPYRPLTNLIDHTPAVLSTVSIIQVAPQNARHSTPESRSHVSGTPPPIDDPTQSAATANPLSPPRPLSQEIPISPTKVADIAASSQIDEKQTMEYTWPDSLMDVDMTSGSEPEHTTLLPDKGAHEHPAVQHALTSLVLGRTVEEDRDDIMAGVQLPIISAPLLPSLVPLNEAPRALESGASQALICLVDLPP